MRLFKSASRLSLNRLQGKIRDNHPKYYTSIVRLVAPFITLFKYGVFKASGREAHWFLQYRAGEKKIIEIWGKDNSLEKPLILNLDRIIKLNFPKYQGCNAFNPTIADNREHVLISWRISNNIVKPFTDSRGRKVHAITGFKGGIGIGSFDKNHIFEEGIIQDCKVLIQPDFNHRIVKHQIKEAFERQIEFDDPRFVPENPNLLLLNGRYHPHSEKMNQPNFAPFLFNISENTLERIEAPLMSRYEKNWVPLSLSLNKLKLLRSTQPLALVEVNLSDLSTQEIIIGQSENSIFHNGTNIILLRNGLYMRIVRQRIHLKGLRAVHFSTFMLHDLDMNLIIQTKPFIFQKYGFEICNSMIQIEDDIFLVWGDNDEDAFMGSVKTEKILGWIFENAL